MTLIYFCMCGFVYRNPIQNHVYMHDRSKSLCFLFEQVMCCDPFGLSLLIRGVFHSSLNDG